MKDKEIIEEMAQCKNFSGMTCSECKVKAGCDRYTLAEELYEQGYRKLPENARVFIPDGQMVLLSSEEYSNYLITQTNNEFLKEQAEKLKADNKRLYKNIGKFKELTVKETVDKIYNYAEKFLFDDPTDNIYFKEYVKEEFGFDIKE